MAKDRKTNNPSASTIIQAKNRPIISLVNRRSILVQTSHRLSYIKKKNVMFRHNVCLVGVKDRLSNRFLIILG